MSKKDRVRVGDNLPVFLVLVVYSYFSTLFCILCFIIAAKALGWL